MKLKLEDSFYSRYLIYKSKKYYMAFDIYNQFIEIDKKSDKNLNNDYEFLFLNGLSGEKYNEKTRIKLIAKPYKKKIRIFEK